MSETAAKVCAEREREFEATCEALKGYVKDYPHPQMMRNQYDRIEAIANGCWSLRKVDGYWQPELTAGTSIGHACETAWSIHCHTGEPVKMTFNGVMITFGLPPAPADEP